MRQFPVKEFEDFVASVMEEHKIPGVAVSVVAGGEAIYKKGFGCRDKESSLPVTPDTIFGVASITKSFSALAVMQLAENGKLSLQDPVQKYIPGFDLPGGGGEAVTIHHFLTHTAGLPPLPTLDYSIQGNTKPDPSKDEVKKDEPKKDAAGISPEEKAKFSPINTYDELIAYIKTGDFTLLGKPGEYLSYSNDCYGLLGVIIEDVTGQTYHDYMREHILEPLAMGRSGFDIGWLLSRANVTALYYKDEDKEIRRSVNWQEAPPFEPCGWLRSTVSDLANYLRMYTGDGVFGARRLLSAGGVRTMRDRHFQYSRDRHYGYGISNLSGYHGVTLAEHSGGLKGVSSNMGYVPEEKIGVAVLTNLSGAPSGKIWLGAINLLLGLPVETPRSVYRKDPWKPEELAARTGRFKSGEGADITISAHDGKLIATADKEKYEIFRDSAEFGVLTMNGIDSEVRFRFDDSGKLWATAWGSRIIQKTGEA